MTFLLRRPGLIGFHDSQPGAHATMFGPHGEKLRFRGELSHFDDAARSYEWWFELAGSPIGLFVFAVADRECAGYADGGGISIVVFHGRVERILDGKPHVLEP